MKKNWILTVILDAGLLVALPSPGFSGNGRYYGGMGTVTLTAINGDPRRRLRAV